MNVDDLAMAIIEVVEEEGGRYRQRPGRVIVTLARRIFDDQLIRADCRDERYCRTDKALLLLEDTELIEVRRDGRRRSERGWIEEARLAL